MDKTVYMTMLFDFYGELLTAKQKEYFNLYYNENLSLAEIAEAEGISRQGQGHDSPRRSGTERKLKKKQA
jgi:predicted DNA-binding protein YlxM (UPF0122 family)